MNNENMSGGDLIAKEQTKAIAEIESQLVIAKRFPRDENECANKIVSACKRLRLAESALYAYEKGDSLVTGPSIRLAEVMAQNWKNMDFGVRELAQVRGVGKTIDTAGHSICQAYCWDTENNVKQEKTFTVPHWRHTRKGGYALSDPREIYEMCANQGARRLRACVLGVIPGWVQDEAIDQIQQTLKNADTDTIEERITKMVNAFTSGFSVTKAMIEKRLGHNVESIQETELIGLRAIYQSLKDGFAKPGKYFEELAEEPTTTEGKAGELNSAIDGEGNE